MRTLITVLCVTVTATLTACANTSANMRVGSERIGLSLAEQRDALQKVAEKDSVPAGAKRIGRVDAARCHRRTDQAPPTEDDVRIDLRLAAYALGADIITDVKIERESALMMNCWYVINGVGVAWQLAK